MGNNIGPPSPICIVPEVVVQYKLLFIAPLYMAPNSGSFISGLIAPLIFIGTSVVKKLSLVRVTVLPSMVVDNTPELIYSPLS